MKYVALLSGGKDSCYNLLHCSKNGHELVAAASLGPEHGKEELDSYLYQTVGQDAIEFVARALEVPLYRRVISGGALDQGAEYGDRDPRQTMGTQGDETEDLYDLLLTVKTHHPDVQGVSVGAILSNYQRVRVEHVCRRLSLTALSYLWQRDQGELMSEMIEAGMQSIIIKVAGIGLTSKHLGMTLSDIHPTLIKLNDLYGSHICGEGGEYETLTLDCPLFKHRVVLKEVETVIHSDNDFATVAFLRIKDAVLERKPAVPHFDIAVPPLLDSAYTDIENSVLHSQKDDADLVVSLSNDASPSILGPSLPTSSKKSGAWVAIANVQRDLQENDVEPLLEDEVSECFHKLEAYLAVHSLSLAHCTHINIFISSMDLFARVNTVYGTFFGTSPPSRACVCVDLSSSIRVRLDCVAFAEDKPSDRQALHVQGLSYWAPANIGPYSQSITVSQRIFISGQIGLLPKSMLMPSPPSLALETALSCQHVDRVVNALQTNSGGGWKGHGQSILYWLANTNDIPHVRKAVGQFEKSARVPTLFLCVKELPKGGLVEKQVLHHTGLCLVSEEEDDEPTLQPRIPVVNQGDQLEGESLVHWETSCFEDSGEACTIVCLRGSGTVFTKAIQGNPALRGILDRALSIRLFHRLRVPIVSSLLDPLLTPDTRPAITLIPCRYISSYDVDGWDYAMCILSNK